MPSAYTRASAHISEADAWRIVRGYIREIVPFFNVIAYYHIGYRLARVVLNFFYKTSVDFEEPGRGSVSRGTRW